MPVDFPPERVAKKRYSAYMEPLQTRLETVRLFLQDLVRPGVLVEVVGIKDDFGPTKSDPNMDLIVGSAETALGCDMGKFVFSGVLADGCMLTPNSLSPPYQ